MEWGIPVAPESRRMDNSPAGDQYSNFNAGKILLILEGIGGLRFSTHDDSFTFADNLPLQWTFMEFRVPVVRREGGDVIWVKARAERSEMGGGGKVTKVVTVENNPFQKLILRPWLEESEVILSENYVGENEEPYHGHKSFAFENANNASVVIHLGK